MLLFTLLSWALFPVFCFAAAVTPALSAEQLKHLKDDPRATHLVYFDIASMVDSKGKEESVGTLQIVLFGEKVPSTVAKFVEKAQSTTNGYQGSIFHRVVKDFVVQGGNLMRKNVGYKAIDFTVFPDENFALKHNKVGRLSMANSGPNTNGCQFFITTGKSFPHLDGKHVVFGQVVLGFETLEMMNIVETLEDRPINDLTITKAHVKALLSPNAAADVAEESRISPGYGYLMILCIVAAVAYAVIYYRGRKTLVDLTAFKM